VPSGETVPPAVASTSAPDAAATPPRNARRSAGAAAAPAGSPAGARRSAARVVAALAPTCTTSAPIVTHAAQKWARGKKNDHGYQPATLAVPETRRNSAPPTSGRSASRSTAWSAERAGGHSTNRGWTTHSLASSSGMAAVPVVTWTPCVMR
jgi:hypothetical protein